MRIVALGFRGFPNVQGGIEKHCEQLYPRLAKFGCEIVILSRAPYTGTTPYNYKGVRVVPIWSPRHKTLESLLHTSLCSLIARKYKPDIIHFHAIGPSVFIPFAKKMYPRVIATHHGFDYEREKWGILAKKFLKYGECNLCKADRVITISDHIREFLIKTYACNATTIPNGVDLPDLIQCGEFCKKYGVGSGKYFLFAGRLVPEKVYMNLLPLLIQ